ncbi:MULTISPECIES: carbonic anhydrase [Streptomyces]|uniref:carbonic anhydrase n=1 Tax=Streptomyces TaxID=1883 RepID=UPI00163C9472|nr:MULTISPECIES: carbonic anhydrase [Streptomyces]MBC2878353.1 carbonic anhydrase [Streptomyces sp. TYQ1024]UBI40531.1 carbonic anhydrase [Streptomyces mobaraensis]UKW33113.1 carbonic anhydrase [Streptomyces sp. TYQ1024]
MHDLARGVARFRRDVFPAKARLFARLAGRHAPEVLFIGCSDARVPPELITQGEPGELFVVRTAGNIVPAYAPGADGVAASIEYAVGVLGVAEVVVCGHSYCGAMTALAEGRDLSATPAVADWLRHADAARARVSAEAPAAGTVDALVRANVHTQLANLATHPCVAGALARGALTLRGWVFDIATGTVEELPVNGSATGSVPSRATLPA